jgi:DNA polymerase/3'-5' exonuclease PolX/predicted flap endonuclease-1-like 5' DNA nuclease
MDTVQKNKEFLQKCIDSIEELIQYKNKIQSLYKKNSDNKNAQAVSFKIRSYQKWLQKLNLLMKDDNFLDKSIDVIFIKSMELTKGLEHKLIEIYEKGKLEDIEKDKELIASLEKEIGKKEIGKIDNKKQTNIISIKKPNKKLTMDKFKIQNVVDKIDVSQIEGIPKQLIDQERPVDERGGAIYDLRLVSGIGEKNAEKFVNEGITLEVLLHDWNTFVEKDINNSITMIHKIPKPDNFSDTQWNSLSSDKKLQIQSNIFRDKINNDSNYLNKLTHHQILGIKYFYDIIKRIPRKEIESTEKFLNKVVKKINPDLQLTVCGSYRRGKKSSGDIDSLITHPKIKTKEEFEKSNSDILGVVVKQLEAIGYLIDHLTDASNTKYMGMGLYSRLSKIARRVDIRFVPFNSYGTAILYFTGSKNFNVNMRKKAISMGYTLSEYGLYKVENGEKIFLECPTEEDVFKKLNMEYVKPIDRDI